MVGGAGTSNMSLVFLGSDIVRLAVVMTFKMVCLESCGIGSACNVILILLPQMVRGCLWVMHSCWNFARRMSAVGLYVAKANPMILVFLSFRWLLRVEMRLLVEWRSLMFAMLGGNFSLGNVSV